MKDKQTAVIGWYSESNFCEAYERKKVFVFFLRVDSFSAVVIVSINAGCCRRDENVNELPSTEVNYQIFEASGMSGR